MARATITAEDYPRMKQWLATFVDIAMPFGAQMPPEVHPIVVLGEMERQSMARARQGLGMAINDMIAMAIDLDAVTIQRVDEAMQAADLPMLSAMRVAFSGQVRRILAKGAITKEEDYYLLREAVELMTDEVEKEAAWTILADYEAKAARLA